MYIYSDFCPKVGCRGNAPLSLVYGSITAKIPRWHKPHLKTKLCTDMLHTTKFMAIFVMFAYFGQKLVAMATSLRPLQSDMSSLDWSTTKNPLL